MRSGDDQQLFDGRIIPLSANFRNSALAVAKRSGASFRGRQTTDGPGVVDVVPGGMFDRPGVPPLFRYLWELRQ